MIGIIAAMEEEMLILKDALKNQTETKILGIIFYEGNLENQHIVLCSSGVGKVNASMAASCLIEYFECDLIINTGIAGGIKGVEPEDIFIGNSLQYADVDATQFGYAFGQVPGLPKAFFPEEELILRIKKILKKLGYTYKEGAIFTTDSFISNLNQLSKVDLPNLCVAEMEGASIAQVCTRAVTSFIVLRYVSDVVGHPSQIKDYQTFESHMAKRSSEICLEIVKYLE